MSVRVVSNIIKAEYLTNSMQNGKHSCATARESHPVPL